MLDINLNIENDEYYSLKRLMELKNIITSCSYAELYIIAIDIKTNEEFETAFIKDAEQIKIYHDMDESHDEILTYKEFVNKYNFKLKEDV